jgi:DNA-binding NtrC family response regulator
VLDVLLIDDELHFLDSLAEGLRVLHPHKLQVMTANSGEKAIGMLKAAAFDVVVTDLHMPGVDGYQLLTHMQDKHPGIPVIIMSAYAKAEVEKHLLDLRFAKYIEKPLALDEVAHAILSTA